MVADAVTSRPLHRKCFRTAKNQDSSRIFIAVNRVFLGLWRPLQLVAVSAIQPQAIAGWLVQNPLKGSLRAIVTGGGA